MNENICYTGSTQNRRNPATDRKHDERITALVRFIARCAASADYHDLHNLIEENLNDEREQ